MIRSHSVKVYIPSLAVRLAQTLSFTDTFLQINDQINTVLTRYEAFKKGDYATARNPIPPEIGSSSGSGGGLSLIDLDDGESFDTTTSATSLGNSTPANDLSGLFLAGSSSQQPFRPTSSIAPQQLSQPQTFSPTPVFANGRFSGSSMAALQQLSQNSTPPASIMLPSTPGSQRGTPVPASQSSSNYFGKVPQQQTTGVGFGKPSQTVPGVFGGPQQLFGSGLSGVGFPAGGSQQQPRPFDFGTSLQPQPQAQHPPPSTSSGPNTQQNRDPFADLAGLF
jgi:hypothetical protein